MPRTVNQSKPRTLDWVEGKINDAVGQGFEVQSFQPVTNAQGTLGFIVLLRRPRK